jgi:hypothetical protein
VEAERPDDYAALLTDVEGVDRAPFHKGQPLLHLLRRRPVAGHLTTSRRRADISPESAGQKVSFIQAISLRGILRYSPTCVE